MPADAASNATIHGFVLDKDTGKPLDDIVVEVFSSSDHSTPIATIYTDIKGYYNTSVQAGDTYDIYVRLGKENPHQTVYVGEGYIQRVDFDISLKSVSSSSIEEGGGFLIVVVVAVIILVIILVDQLYVRKKRQRELSELESEKQHLEEKLAGEEPEDELSVMEKEKARIEYMINLTKTKYHKRKIDEESFREIMRDYQKSIIEIEAKIRELKGE